MGYTFPIMFQKSEPKKKYAMCGDLSNFIIEEFFSILPGFILCISQKIMKFKLNPLRKLSTYIWSVKNLQQRS